MYEKSKARVKLIKTFLSGIYIFWVFLVFTGFMILLLPGIILPFVIGQRYGWISYQCLTFWSWIFSKLTFIRYTIIGQKNVTPGKPYIFISNHTSFLDIPGVTMAIPGEFRPLAKKELQKIPVFGWIAKKASVIVDRSNAKSRMESLDRLKRILKMGISILIFVEGTQNRTQEVLQPFKDGAFRMAIDTNHALLPIVIIGAGKLMPPGTIQLRPGKIKVIIGEEIPVAGLSINDISILKAQSFVHMKKMFEENSY